MSEVLPLPHGKSERKRKISLVYSEFVNETDENKQCCCTHLVYTLWV